MDDKLTLIVTSLQRLQEEGGKNNYCIFTSDIRRNYYIQFAGAQGETRLRAEAVSNQFLESRYALTEAQMTQLQELGWRLDSTQSPNFHREFEAQDEADRTAIAELVLRTLTEVYGLLPTQPLVVHLALE